MKKLLSILGVITLTGVGATSVVACGGPLREEDFTTPPVEVKPEDIETLLKQEVVRQIDAHLLTKSSVFELTGDESSNNNYKFFSEDNIKTIFKAYQGTDFVDYTLNSVEDINYILEDLSQILYIGEIRNQLEELKKDEYFGYGYFLSGLNDPILKDITISKSNKIQLKRTGNEDEPTYQIKVSFDINWQYLKENNIVDETILNNEFLFTLTSNQNLNTIINEFNSVYKKDFLIKNDSLTHFDEKKLGKALDSAGNYSAYAAIDQSTIDNWYNGNNEVMLQNKMQEILENVAGGSQSGFKLDFKKAQSPILNNYFDFFNQEAAGANWIGDKYISDGLYYYIQNKLFGNSDDTPEGFVSGNELLATAIAQYLYDGVIIPGIENTVYGINQLKKLTNVKFKDLLIENEVKFENVGDKIKNNIWSMGYITISNVEFTFDNTSITLSTLNIPYTYSISNLVTSDEATLQEKEFTVNKFIPVVEYWTKQIHDIMKFNESDDTTLMTVSKSSDLYSKITNESLVHNPKDISKETFQKVLNNTNKTNDKLKVKFDFFIELTNFTLINDSLGNYQAKYGDTAHIYVKIGFINLYLAASDSWQMETSKMQKVWEGNADVIKFVD